MPKADPQTESQVNESLDKLLAAYSAGRVDEAMGYAAKDDDITLLEPGVDQVWVGQQQVRQGIQFDWETTEGEMPIEITRRWVSVKGDVAWVNGENQINLNYKGQDMTLEGRFTAIALREDGDWRWHTLHFGSPDSQQSPGEAWPSQVGVSRVEGSVQS